LLALLSLTMTGEAFGQVRSTIQATARVVEAGPGWAAHAQVVEAADIADALASRYWHASDEVLVFDPAESPAGIPRPRVTLVRESLQADPGCLSRRTVVDCGLGFDATPLVARLVQSGEGYAPLHDPARAARTTEPAPLHIIIYVEHISN
jgi:hypothetical protein